MAEPTEQPASAEERQKRIEEQTSVGRYTLKQFQQIGTTLIGAIGGFFAGKGLLRIPKIAAWAEKLSFMEIFKGKSVFTAASTFVGMMLSSIVIAYEHWRNVESEKLAVGEINKDVANLVTERTKFAETLNRQETLIKELVAKGQKKGSFTERATPAASPDMARS